MNYTLNLKLHHLFGTYMEQITTITMYLTSILLEYCAKRSSKWYRTVKVCTCNTISLLVQLSFEYKRSTKYDIQMEDKQDAQDREELDATYRNVKFRNCLCVALQWKHYNPTYPLQNSSIRLSSCWSGSVFSCPRKATRVVRRKQLQSIHQISSSE